MDVNLYRDAKVNSVVRGCSHVVIEAQEERWVIGVCDGRLRFWNGGEPTGIAPNLGASLDVPEPSGPTSSFPSLEEARDENLVAELHRRGWTKHDHNVLKNQAPDRLILISPPSFVMRSPPYLKEISKKPGGAQS